jgi:hypothetical protein
VKQSKENDDIFKDDTEETIIMSECRRNSISDISHTFQRRPDTINGYVIVIARTSKGTLTHFSHDLFGEFIGRKQDHEKPKRLRTEGCERKCRMDWLGRHTNYIHDGIQSNSSVRLSRPNGSHFFQRLIACCGERTPISRTGEGGRRLMRMATVASDRKPPKPKRESMVWS